MRLRKATTPMLESKLIRLIHDRSESLRILHIKGQLKHRRTNPWTKPKG